MSPTGKFTFKLVIYGAFLLYLVGDLFLWHGFLAGSYKKFLAGLQSFAVIESERCINGKTSFEQRLYISSLPADAKRLAQAVRSHWAVENQLHWCMDVAFADDQMRARTGHAAHNLAILKHITLNLIRLDPIKRKGGIKARRLIAATSDLYRAQLLGLA